MVIRDEDPPFFIEVLDRAFVRQAFVKAPRSIKLAPRHMKVTTAELVLDPADEAVPALLDEGARLRITYRGKLHTGAVELDSGTGPGGDLTFAMTGDLAIVLDLLGWQNPASPLSGQVSEYDIRSGPAEDVAKAIIGANALRAGVPLRVAPSWGRGARIRVTSRMDNLNDVLMAAVEGAGIGLTVVQDGPGYVLDCYATGTDPRLLTEDSGVVSGWVASRARLTATRVVLGFGGDGITREYVQVIDHDLEARYGRIAEVFVDADDAASDYRSAKGDVDSTSKVVADMKTVLAGAVQDRKIATLDLAAHAGDPAKQQALTDAVTAEQSAQTDLSQAQGKAAAALLVVRQQRELLLVELDARGKQRLAEGAPTSGVAVTLSETDAFSYAGDGGLEIGDRFRVEVSGGLVVERVLSEVQVSWATGAGVDGGLKTIPVVGEVTSDSKTVVQAINKVRSTVRGLLSKT